jgi:uncharacterized protein YbjT (DUF2867 family)
VAKLLVIGATGYVGEIVTRLALDNPSVAEVIAPTRRQLLLKDPRLKNPIVNFDALDEEAPWWSVDAAISALGTTTRNTPSQADYEKIETSYPVTIATLVRNRGAKAFVYVSSIGASVSSRWFYLRTKGKTENQLQRLGLPSLTLVRPSGIIGPRQPPRPSEELALGLFQIARPLLPKRWRVVTGEQVAKALLGAALMPPPGTNIIESENIQNLK